MLESIISYLNEVSGNQPMIVSAIMLPITSGLAYLFKDVPADTVKTHFTNLYGPLPEIESWSDMVGSSIYQIKERALNDRFIAIKLINHYNNTGTINTVL